MKIGSGTSKEAYSSIGGALALLTIPYVFTQDGLLATDRFITKAKERGHRLSLDDLEMLHNHRLLIPLYRVSDIPVEGHRIDVKLDGGMNARGWTLEAAVEGRLRDASEEGYSTAWPYKQPPDEEDQHWWNGFVYSTWQLLSVRSAINEYEFVKAGRLTAPFDYHRRARDRRLILTLAALATRYFSAASSRCCGSSACAAPTATTGADQPAGSAAQPAAAAAAHRRPGRSSSCTPSSATR